VSRAVQLTSTATWWPSVLWQTTTLEVVRGGERLLVDPGIAPWEVREAAGDGADNLLITHADWDHVMGIGLLPDARVHASPGAAERIRSGQARSEVESETRPYGLPLEGLDGLRVDQLLPESGGETTIGSFAAVCHPAPGHTPDGFAVLLLEEGLLIAGDHLSLQEVPFIQDSAWRYLDTLHMLTAVIERERPALVVIGHGPPHPGEAALRVAAEDIAYVEALIRYAEAGGSPDSPQDVPHPQRGSDDEVEHAGNLRRTCEAFAAR
jgi:glyoxylase-like metal-dependent hydrolase (beta-lactamase superfamily II)